MAFDIAVGDYLEVRLWCWEEDLEQAAVNTIRYFVRAMTGGAEVGSGLMAVEFSEYYADKYKDVLAPTARFAGVGIQDFPARMYMVEYSNADAGLGTLTGDVLPGQVSGLIGLRTNYAKPRGRGRLFIPFPPESANDEFGKPAGTYLTNLQTLGNLMTSNMSLVVGGVTVVMDSIITNATNTRVPMQPITEAIAEAAWGSQHRRGYFGKRNQLPIELA